MVDTERREQILKAEASIRQLAEAMAENLASRKAADDEIAALRRGSQSLDEANRTLSIATERAGESLKTLTDAQTEWRRTVASLQKASADGVEKIEGCSLKVISPLQESKASSAASISEMHSAIQSGNSAFAEWCGAVEFWKTAANDGAAEITSCSRQVLSDFQVSQTTFDTSIAEMRSEMQTGNEIFSRTATLLAKELETRQRAIEELALKQSAAFEAGQQNLKMRINLGSGLCCMLLIAILLILMLR